MTAIDLHSSINNSMGTMMRIAQAPCYLPPPDARPTRGARSGEFSTSAQFAAEGDDTISPLPRSTPSLTFLTQYLVREIMPRGEVPASRWSQRDAVYRLGAQVSGAASGQLSLDA